MIGAVVVLVRVSDTEPEPLPATLPLMPARAERVQAKVAPPVADVGV